MQRIILVAIVVMGMASVAMADPAGTYHSVMDWRTAGGGYKVLQGSCTFGVVPGGQFVYQCPGLVSNDGTCKASVYAVLEPAIPPYQVQFQLLPFGSGKGCPAGGSPSDLLTNTNPGAWYWTCPVGAKSCNEIDFSATDSTGTIEIVAPWRNVFKSNP